MTNKNIVGICCTDGSSMYSSEKLAVAIIRLDLSYIDGETLFDSSFGELRAYFDESSWNVNDHGYIYTDEQWLTEFRRLMHKHGFSERAVESIEYSENSMQGVDYVSMDVGDPFIIECDQFYNFIEGHRPKKINIEVSALDS